MRTPQESLNRLARNMQIAQIAMATRPPAALFALQVEAVMSACEEALQTLQSMRPDTPIQIPETLLGRNTADVLADALYQPAPDTPEGLT